MNTGNDTILTAEEIALLQELLDNSEGTLGTRQTETIVNAKLKLSRLTEVYHIIQDSRFDAINQLVSQRLALESAITKKHIVSFCYTRYGTYHTVEPYRIVQASGVNYLVAGRQERFKKRLKKYCLDFIDELEVTDKYYDAIPRSVVLKLAGAKTIWFNEQTPVKVVVEFDQRVAHFFRREQFFSAQEIIEENNDGSIVITVEASNRMDFFLQAARWMPNFRIIHPPEFRQLIFEKALQTLERNKPLHVSLKNYQRQGALFAVRNSVLTLLRPLGLFVSAVRTHLLNRIPNEYRSGEMSNR